MAKRKSYNELLRDPRWQKKRLKILERDGWACRRCGDKEEMLNVHHECYEKGKDPCEYSDATLTTLCETCHGWITSSAKLFRTMVSFAVSSPVVEEMIGYTFGLMVRQGFGPIKMLPGSVAEGFHGALPEGVSWAAFCEFVGEGRDISREDIAILCGVSGEPQAEEVP